MKKKTAKTIAFALACACAGCRRAPAFNVLGSFFPGWIACTIGGIAIAAIIRLVLYRRHIEEKIKLLPLFYVSLTVFFACVLWLVFFE